VSDQYLHTLRRRQQANKQQWPESVPAIFARIELAKNLPSKALEKFQMKGQPRENSNKMSLIVLFVASISLDIRSLERTATIALQGHTAKVQSVALTSNIIHCGRKNCDFFPSSALSHIRGASHFSVT
jgi:hypothetical protein